MECVDDKRVAFVRCFRVDLSRVFCHDSGFVVKHIIPLKETSEIQLVPTTNLLFKVIRVGSYVCLRPNKYEVNL